jgi:hypothetical protein
MEQEGPDAQPEKNEIGAEPVKTHSVALDAVAEGVRFVVDGQVAKALPFETYEAFYKNLTRGLEFNIFPLEIPGLGEIKLQLPPLIEVRAGAVELRSLDGVTYGRHYKFISMEKEADGASYAVVALAETGEVVEREPWDDFKRRVQYGRCRSGTAYGAMLGEVSPRLYFDVTGEIYKPQEERPRAREAAAEEKKPAPEVEMQVAEEEFKKKEPVLTQIAADMGYLPKKLRFVFVGAAIVLIVLILVTVMVRRGQVAPKPKLEVTSAAGLDYHLNQEYEIAKHLSAVDFARYARDYPQAAKDSVENLAAFVERNRSTPGLTPAQAEKMLFISNALPRLQAELAKANSN